MKGWLPRKQLCIQGCGVLLDNRMNMSQQCTLGAKMASSLLSCISITNRYKEIILPPYLPFVRLHLVCWAQFWAPWYNKEIDALKWIHWESPSWSWRWNTGPHRRDWELHLFSLTKRRLGNLQLPSWRIQKTKCAEQESIDLRSPS